MKRNLLSLAFLLFFAVAIQAQDYPLKKGAKLAVEESTIELSQDLPLEIGVEILRSKAERKTKFAAPTIQKIDGLAFEISPKEEVDAYTLKLIPQGIAPGDYTLIIKGSGPNKRYLTSRMLALKVVSNTSVAATNQ